VGGDLTLPVGAFYLPFQNSSPYQIGIGDPKGSGNYADLLITMDTTINRWPIIVQRHAGQGGDRGYMFTVQAGGAVTTTRNILDDGVGNCSFNGNVVIAGNLTVKGKTMNTEQGSFGGGADGQTTTVPGNLSVTGVLAVGSGHLFSSGG